jgi:ectoine hydroxylase
MVNSVPTRIAGLTSDERSRFDRDGYFLIAGALSADEVAELIDVIDTITATVRRDRGLGADVPVSVRNIVCRHPAFLRLLDRAPILARVVGLMGPRIQLRGSNFDVRPPQPGIANPMADRFLEWHRDQPAGGWPTVAGVVPFMELKVGYYLTEVTAPCGGALRIRPGSHRWPQDSGRDGSADPDRVVELEVTAGTALIWRTSLLHQVAPNHSGRTRKCIYLAYQHRWLRPSDYVSTPADMLTRANPVQRQLLGALGERMCLLADPDVEPCSPYWTPRPEDVPLQAWARAHGIQIATDHEASSHDLPPLTGPMTSQILSQSDPSEQL